MRNFPLGRAAAAMLSCTILITANVSAQDQQNPPDDSTSHPSSAQKAAYKPEKRIDDAVVAVGKMKQDSTITQLLQRANGILIVPHYLKAAAVIGAQGGDGVLLARRDEHWSDPAFYHLGGGTIGVQVGGTAGSIALLLMTDKAVKAFETHNSTWSIDSSAGLNVVNYSAEKGKEFDHGDVVIWSEMKGLFGGAAVGVRDVRRDESADRKYYEQPNVTSQAILTGQIKNPHESNATTLRDVLPLRLASK